MSKSRISRADDSNIVLGQLTSVRIGLLIAFLGVFGAAIHWATTMNSKLDSIIVTQTAATLTFSRLDSETANAISKLKSKDISIDRNALENKSLFDKEISDIRLKMALQSVDIKSLQDKLVISSK